MCIQFEVVSIVSESTITNYAFHWCVQQTLPSYENQGLNELILIISEAYGNCNMEAMAIGADKTLL